MRTWFAIFLLSTSFYSSSAAEGFDTTVIGTWEAFDLEPDPGRHVATVRLTDRYGSIALVCSGGDWAAYFDRESPTDDRIHRFSDFDLRYKLGDGPWRLLGGEGQRGYGYNALHANSFVRELAARDGRLTFDLGGKRLFVVDIKSTKAAVTPFLSRCPL